MTSGNSRALLAVLGTALAGTTMLTDLAQGAVAAPAGAQAAEQRLAALHAAPADPRLAQQAQGRARQMFRLGAQPLGAALRQFSAQTGIQVAYNSPELAGRMSDGISGMFTPEEALAGLLKNSGAGYRFTYEDAVLVRVAQAGPVQTDANLATINVEGGQSETGPVEGQESAWGPVDGFVATRSATGTKTDTAIIEVPQSVSVVTRDQVEVQGAESIEQALTYTPGVVVDSYGSNPEQDYIFLRGFQAPLFVDGLRHFRDYIVGAQVGFEPYAFERIEVLRGPASVLYGQAEVGGIVNMISKRPTDTPQHEILLQYGSFEHKQAAFDFSGPMGEGGNFSYRLTGVVRDADGQMDFQGDDRFFIAPALQWKNEDTRLTVLANLQRDRDQLRPVPLPAVGTIFPNPNGKLPYDRFVGEPLFDAFERDQFSIGYEFEHELSDIWTLRQNLRYTHVDQLENFSLPLYDFLFLFDDRTVERLPWNDEHEIGVFSVDNQAQAKFATGGAFHTLLFGLDYSRIRSDWDFSTNFDYQTIDAFDPVYTSYGPIVQTLDDTRRQRQTGAYVQDVIAIDKWRFTLGGRYDWTRGSTESRLSNFYGGPEQIDEAFTWRAGAVYLFDSGLAPYASYATSFDPPTGADAFGNPLKPTEGEQYEVGVKYQPPGRNSFITLAAFDITKQNVLTTAFGSPRPVQLGEVQVRGFEAEAKVELMTGFSLLGAYTFLDSEITENQVNPAQVGLPLFMTPENQFALWADYEFQAGPLDGFGIGAGVRYRGPAWGLNHEIETPAYALMDASLRYDMAALGPKFEGYSLAITVRNLLDKEYIPACSFTEGCFYGDRRNVIGTVKYRW